MESREAPPRTNYGTTNDPFLESQRGSEETSSSLLDQFPSFVRPIISVLIILLGAICFITSNVIVKLLENVDYFTINGITTALMAIFSLFIIVIRRLPLFPKGVRVYLLLRGLLGVFNFLAFTFALKHMPIGDINVIGSSTPAIVVFMAWFFLGEHLVVNDFINIFVMVLGVLLVTQPSFLFTVQINRDESYGLAALLLLSSCVSWALCIVIMRRLKDLPFVSITLMVGLESFLCSVAGGYFMFDQLSFPQNLSDFLAVFAIAILLFLTETSSTVACQIEDAGIVSLLQQAFSVSLAYIFQFIIFEEFPNISAILGIALVLLVCLNISCRKLIENLSPDHKLHVVYSNFCCVPLHKEGK